MLADKEGIASCQGRRVICAGDGVIWTGEGAGRARQDL